MEEKILKAIGDFELIKSGQCVTVALSGGADSMALLVALNNLKGKLGITVNAAHFNHKIRGNEAESDQKFVERQCEIHKTKLFLGSANIPLIAKETKQSLELAARNERYKFLGSVGADVIATAHTSSDNLETVLFNLARGTALKGLCGIPAKRDRFVRPLIYCTRDEIIDYCKKNNICFVTDSTNLCDDYSRNKIRHKAVPILKEINPSIERSLSRTIESLNEDNLFLEKLADDELELRFTKKGGLCLKNFTSLDKCIAKRVISKYYFSRLGFYPDNFHINSIYDVCMNGSKTSISKNYYATVQEGHLFFESKNSQNQHQYQYNVELVEKNIVFSEIVYDLLLNNTLDCDKIIGKLEVRGRLPGDKIFLNKSNGTKTLKKLYTEYAVPLRERPVWPVIADDDGVVWIYGIGVAKRCAVTSQTKKIISVKITKKRMRG